MTDGHTDGRTHDDNVYRGTIASRGKNRNSSKIAKLTKKQVCIQPRHWAINITLPAFAAERRAAAPLLLSASGTLLLVLHCMPVVVTSSKRAPVINLRMNN